MTQVIVFWFSHERESHRICTPTRLRHSTILEILATCSLQITLNGVAALCLSCSLAARLAVGFVVGVHLVRAVIRRRLAGVHRRRRATTTAAAVRCVVRVHLVGAVVGRGLRSGRASRHVGSVRRWLLVADRLLAALCRTSAFALCRGWADQSLGMDAAYPKAVG
jgi:hypothetical protein